MSNLVAEFYRQNEWANIRLLAVCRDLTDDQLNATTPGTYGTIMDTLVHLADAERSYATRLGGTYEGPRLGSGAFRTFDAIETAVRESARELIKCASRVETAPFAYQHGDEKIDASIVLVQAVNHSTEHRSQICTILTTLGITPPELDGWSWGETTGRIWKQ